jgi:hypothetical protein
MSCTPDHPIGRLASRGIQASALGRCAPLLAILGCSTADGLPPPPYDTEPYDDPPPPADSADSTGGDGDQQPPPEYGDQCGADVLGWQTSCTAWSTKRSYSDPIQMTTADIEDELASDFASLCCEGMPSPEEANSGCQDLCMLQLCEQARQTHMWWALDVAPGCLISDPEACGFDVAACLVGNPHIQMLDDPNDLLDPLDYFLDVGCSAYNASDVAVGGHWLWLEYPDNVPENDPPMCAPSSGLGNDPDTRPSQFIVSEGPGTQATFAWALGEAHGIETTQDLSIDAGYALVPCDGGRSQCVVLSGLDVRLPATIVHGISLGEHRLSLEEARPDPFELVRDRFVLPDHALRFTLTGSVNDLPIFLTGYNEGPAQGRISSSTLTLTGLHLGYHDEVFQADLRVDVSATTDESKPSASIRLLDAPASCSEAVMFDASSTDADGEALSHVWWYPPAGFSTGSTLLAAMAPGSHPILVIARDPKGRSDATGIRYDRACQ